MRKHEELTINDGGENKTFVFTEMGALKTQKWLVSFAKVLAQAGAFTKDLIDEDEDGDALQKIIRKLQKNPALLVDVVIDLDDEQAHKTLVNLVTSCYTYQGLTLTEDSIDNFIDDLGTLLKLEQFAIMQHLSFLSAGKSLFFPVGTTKTAPATALATNTHPTGKRTSAPSISRLS